MPRFFIDDPGIRCDDPVGAALCITGDDARHVSLSLRMRVGDPLTVCDGTGTDYFCRITSIVPGTVELEVQSFSKSVTEPPVLITLYQCYLKGDQADDLIRGCVELGVGRIVMVRSQNAVSRPDASSEQKKLVRWNRIAREAAMQCGRGAIPTVEESVDFSEAAQRLSRDELGFACCETERELSLKTLLDRPRPKSCSFLVGPEGGLAQSELETLDLFGVPRVTLGTRILRARTAPLAALSALLFRWEL